MYSEIICVYAGLNILHFNLNVSFAVHNAKLVNIIPITVSHAKILTIF